MDGAGCGAAPDAAKFDDVGTNTIGHVAEKLGGIRLPVMESMGLGRITTVAGVDPRKATRGGYGQMIEKSVNKDTTTGHWEMGGLIINDIFPTYPNGFPRAILDPFEKAIGRKTLGNKSASGTEIMDELGEEHMKTGAPIVYTSADSVFQIAAHEEIIPLPELYKICKQAREILQGPHRLGRVIARPFIGKPGAFKRTPNRHDYSIPPPGKTILNHLEDNGYEVIGVGKIKDIFTGSGVTESIEMKSDAEGMKAVTDLLDRDFTGLVFLNLVDFDSLFGHRRDVRGFADELIRVDAALKTFAAGMRNDDLLMITADHGNDPTYKGSDHTRENVPLIVYSPSMRGTIDLGRRDGFWDIGQTLSENFNVPGFPGAHSFLKNILPQTVTDRQRP